MEAALAGFGAIWAVSEILMFFFPSATDWIRARPTLFLLCGAAYVAWRARPQSCISAKLTNRDIWIELRIADILSCDAAVVISAQRTFETDIDSKKIAADSLQGQFTKKYYDSSRHLQADVAQAVAQLPHEMREAAAADEGNFAVGTTIRVEAPGKVAYLLAFPRANKFGTTSASFDELKQSLPALWEAIMQRGQLETISVPVLGSGRARVLAPRETIVREIVQSFVAACSAGRFCDRLIVVISPTDFNAHQIPFRELGQFIRHVCSYTTTSDTGQDPAGVGIVR